MSGRQVGLMVVSDFATPRDVFTPGARDVFTPGALYRSPSGRLCRWSPGKSQEVADFDYIRTEADGRLTVTTESFGLTRQHWPLMTRVR